MTSQKSLKINMLLNAIKGILDIVFPLITFPYISKIFGVTNIGKYNFAYSIITYYLLIAALGIKTYAIREGAKLRESRNDFESFANQMLTINVISTVVAYLTLAITMLIVPKLSEYRVIISILSLQILFVTLGVEWIYTVYEDFVYITALHILSNIVSLVMMFAFVHTKEDLNIYVVIVVFASVGFNIVNFFNSKKYCKLRLVSNIEWKRHFKPIMVLFSMQVATTIYISSDTTMLGVMCNNDVVGVYSVSTKIYSVIKAVLASIIIASIPRLATLTDNEHKKNFTETAKDIYGTLLTMVVPSIIGIIILRKQIILIISDETYLSAISSLIILCIALLFCLCAWFWGQCILVLHKKENYVFKVTIISAITNVILNLVLIPKWMENAAALTTVVAEAIAFIMQWWSGRKYVDFSGMWKCYLKIMIGCTGILAVGALFNSLADNTFVYVILVIVTSIIVYGIIEIFLKNSAVYGIVAIIKKKIRN